MGRFNYSRVQSWRSAEQSGCLTPPHINYCSTLLFQNLSANQQQGKVANKNPSAIINDRYECNGFSVYLTIKQSGEDVAYEVQKTTDQRADALTVTGGLDRECCGEERITGGIPRAGLVPGPLPPAN